MHPFIDRTSRAAVTTLLAATLLMQCGPGGCFGPADRTESTTELKPHEIRTSGESYTVLVYIVGSDLESEGGAATDDLQEMAAVGSQENLNIIVQTGGARGWDNDLVDPRSVQRWRVERDGFSELQSLGDLNMGAPKQLADFITYGVKNHPADRFVLILWNHGAGAIDGFGADENFNHDTLTLTEMGRAFRTAYAKTKTKFEILGFDTCLMATLETAHLAEPYAEYLVASEELEPGHGWDYTAFLKPLAEDPSMPGPELGKYIVDGFVAQADEQGNRANITLSVIDLALVPDIVATLGRFVDSVWPDDLPEDMADDEVDQLEADIYSVARARTRSQDYGNSYEEETFTDMVDLGDFVARANRELELEAGDAVLNALDRAVLYNVNGSGTKNASGLTIYFPCKDKDAFERNLRIYDRIDFPETYKSFIAEYAKIMLEDEDPVNFEEDEPDLVEDDEFKSRHDGARSKKKARGEQRIYETKISDAKIADLDRVYSVVMRVDETTGRWIVIGMDNDVWLEDRTAKLEWYGETVTLDGRYVSFFVDYEDEEITEYSIPIKLNGRSMDLSVLVDNETGDYEILGALGGVDAVTHIADRRMYSLKAGDKITPRFFYIDENDNEGVMDGETFTLSKGFDLEYVPLKPGNYLLSFQTLDFAQNEDYSTPIKIDVE